MEHAKHCLFERRFYLSVREQFSILLLLLLLFITAILTADIQVYNEETEIIKNRKHSYMFRLFVYGNLQGVSIL
jgi:hypothetical protein